MVGLICVRVCRSMFGRSIQMLPVLCVQKLELAPDAHKVLSAFNIYEKISPAKISIAPVAISVGVVLLIVVPSPN